MRERPPGFFRNPLVIAGAFFALVSLANIVFLLLSDILAARERPYVGIFTYLILPSILVLSLLVLAAGLVSEVRRRRASGLAAFPIIDLNLPIQRRIFAGVVIGGGIFVLLSLVGSYQFYQFADSVTFCGQACHPVMKPEFTASQISAHARVSCTECHVGGGATWFVRSKFSGTAQAIAFALDRYPRPIPTPIKNLRPAQETCERCHWPEKFWGDELRRITHFAADERNTRREIQLLMKVGGGGAIAGEGSGIHWHMNLSHEVRYIARDPQRQEVLWVQAKDQQGRVTEYLAGDAKLSPDEIAKADKRRMDCMDCHNRPSHIYQPPDKAVDESLLAGRLDRSLPFIKREAVKALAAPYPSTAQAKEGIAKALDTFYRTQYPGLARQKGEAVRKAIVELQRIYEVTTFPEMKVNWRTYPDNIGHFRFPGCFRCHDGQHVSREGKLIRKECAICHVVVAQAEGGKPVPVKEGEFIHPVDLGDLTAVTCSDCHTGGPGP
jgi:hypothetical protein